MLTRQQRRILTREWGKVAPEALAAELGVPVREVHTVARELGLRNEPRRLTHSGYAWPVLLALAFCSLALYGNNLHNELVYDDLEAIVKNESAHGMRNTWRIFTSPSWWSQTESYVHHYRPLTTFTYAINYEVHGLSREGYHVVNNLLHGVVSWLVFLVLMESGVTLIPSLIAALLFLTHPVHTEAVDWINCRADILAGLFILMSLLAHIHATRAQGRRRGWLVAGSVGSFVLAGLAKETGYMTPFVLVAWDWLMRRELTFRTVVIEEEPASESRNHSTPSPLRGFNWTEYALHAAVLVGFLLIRRHFVGGAAEATITKMNSPLGGAGFMPRLLTGSYVIARCLWILLWPAELSVDYSPDAITRVSALADGRAALGLGAVVAYIVVMILLAKRSRITSFAMATAIIVIAPAANVAFPIGTIMAERLMYLPALAVCVPLALGVWKLGLLRKSRQIVYIVAGAITLAYSVRTYARAADWHDEEALFRAALEVSPRSAMANKNLGGALHNAGRHDEAIPYYQKAIGIVYEFPNAHSELGNCYFSIKPPSYPDAVREYQIALQLTKGHHASAHMNLGATYFMMERSEDALREFSEALKIDPYMEKALYNRIFTLVELGRAREARRALDEAVKKFPDSEQRQLATSKVESALLPSGK